jgi:electron transport complex protein RnfG
MIDIKSVSFNKMRQSGLSLLLFALLGTVLVTATYLKTREQIEDNVQTALLQKLNTLILSESYNNALLRDKIEVYSSQWLGTDQAVVVYRAFQDNTPVALAFSPIAPNGYGGEIQLLIGIDAQGQILGVRSIKHQETPGLGDGIDLRRSDWMLAFDTENIAALDKSSRWQVKKTGGDFDHLTGATITSNAVIQAVHRSLQFFVAEKQMLFVLPESMPDQNVQPPNTLVLE